MTWLPQRAIARLEGVLRDPDDTVAERLGPSNEALRSGEVLAERFSVEELLATGGMGCVYRGHDRESGRKVAIKILRDLGNASRGRFERETAILERLDHPRIVRYVARGRTEWNEPYVVTELLEGTTLSDVLRRGPLSPAAAVRLARLACEPLGHAHALGIVHRDLKPSNLFLVGGDIEGLCLLDFGLAKPLATLDEVTQIRHTVGTPGYMAPEQARGGDVTPRSDVFALGCVLFESLAGVPAFAASSELELMLKIAFGSAPPLRTLVSDLPEALEAAVARMTARDPLARPADATEAAALLVRLLDLELYADEEPMRFEGEQRVMSVVVALPTSSSDVRTETGAVVHDARAAVAGLGGELVELTSGVLVATVTGEGNAARQAVRAARCALSLQNRLPRHAIALATGRGMLGGGLPSGEALERATLLAEAVARGEPHGRALPVRLDELTAHLLGAHFELTADGRWFWREADAPAPAPLLGRVSPLLGRGDDVNAIVAMVRESVEHRVARHAIVTGPPGIGKSRLLHELGRVARLAVPSLAVFEARCEATTRGARFGLLVQLLQSAAPRDREPEAPLRDVVERTASALGSGESARVRTFLFELLGLAGEHTPTTALATARHDARVMGDQLRRAWRDWLWSECRDRPVLLLIDDVHAADQGSLEALGALLHEPSGLALSVVTTALPEAAPWHDGAQHLELSPLAAGSIATMTSHALDAAATPAVVGWVIEHAQGNPLNAEELIRAAARGSAGTLPPPLVAMMHARFETLEASSRRLLRAASVFGTVFWLSGLAALIEGSARDALESELESLCDREVLEARRLARFVADRQYAFRHPALREAAYASLTDDDRVLAHGLAARWLEEVGERAAVIVADHYERGRLPRLARGAYLRAARQALESGDLQLAIECAERALECGASGNERHELLLLQAEARGWMGDFAEVERLAAEAAAEVPSASLPWLVATCRGAIARGMGGAHDTLEPAVMALSEALCDREVPRTLLVEACAMAVHLARGGRAGPAAMLVRAAERSAIAEDGDPLVTAQLELARSVLSLHEGDISTSLEQRLRAIAAFERAGDVRGASRERGNAGFLYGELGDAARAEQCLRAALAEAEQLGLCRYVAVAQHNLGIALTRSGQIEDATALLEAAVAWFSGGDDPRLESHAQAALAEARLAACDLAGAEASAHAAIAAAPAAPQRCWARATLAAVLLRAGKVNEALFHARAAKRDLEFLGGIGGGEAFVPLVLVQALFASGDGDTARLELASAAARVRQRAARIRNEQQRASFLGVPENERTLQLADEWSRRGE